MKELFFLFTARVTRTMVNTNYSATFWTGPALFLCFYKFSDTVLPDWLKVLNHTHPIFFSVPLVKLPESFTRELSAVVMVPAPDHRTCKNGTVFSAFSFCWPAPVTPVFLPEKSQTNCTVHATGSDKFCFHQVFCGHGFVICPTDQVYERPALSISLHFSALY